MDTSASHTYQILQQTNYAPQYEYVAAQANPNYILHHSEPTAVPQSKPRRRRTIFHKNQLAELEREFLINRYAVEARRSDIAKRLGLDKSQIKIWFQNRRQKAKKEQFPEDVNLSSLSQHNNNQTALLTPPSSPEESMRDSIIVSSKASPYSLSDVLNVISVEQSGTLLVCDTDRFAQAAISSIKKELEQLVAEYFNKKGKTATDDYCFLKNNVSSCENKTNSADWSQYEGLSEFLIPKKS